MKRYIFFPVILFLSLPTLIYAQGNEEELATIKSGNAPVNLGQLLLEGANDGKLKLLWFDEFGGNSEEISIGSIQIFDEDLQGEEWQETEIYYEGDLITYNGKQYANLVDNNEGNKPDITDSWEEYAEVWNYIENVNSFLWDNELPSLSQYIHLYYSDLNGESNIPKYLASFDTQAAINYLNETDILWYILSENGHLTGSIFLSYSNALFMKAADKKGIKLSGQGLSYEDLANKWWVTTRNFALGDEDEFVFVYADDSIMWSLPLEEVVTIGENKDSQFLLLGDALASGIVFEAGTNIDQSAQKVEKVQSFIIERFFALETMLMMKDNQKTRLPVSTSGISEENWSYFIEMLTEGASMGKWTPYISSNLDQKLTKRELEFRLTINEEEAGELSFENDQWNKTVTYYFEDVIDYGGLLYMSLKENNVNHHPEQWPEYWQEFVADTDKYYPDELRNVKVNSSLVFTATGMIESITPQSFCLQIPGDYVPSGFNKDIAWFDLREISDTGDEIFDSMVNMIRSHNFRAELQSYQPLLLAK